jgi:peptidylprolyl isomerase
VKRALVLFAALGVVAGCAHSSKPAAAVADSAAPSPKPSVSVPTGPPPQALRTIDMVVGKGAEATTGKSIVVHYVGVNYADGKQFDSSWDSGQPFGPFTLGAGSVIPGWDQGIVGMRVGGIRELIIPPSLAYGAAGRPPVIQPNETLIFVVQLLQVH